MCALVCNKTVVHNIKQQMALVPKTTKISFKVLRSWLKTSHAGYIIDKKGIENAFGHVSSWIETNCETQPILIGISGNTNKIGHCICIMNNQIVDALYERSFPFTDKNLEFALGDKPIQIVFCKTFYPNEKSLLPNVGVMSYQSYQRIKRKK